MPGGGLTLLIYIRSMFPYVAEKSLKILKGSSLSVIRRRIDNTMGKRKSTKGQTTIYKPYI